MIEFKIRHPGMRWEDTPVFATINAWQWSKNCTERERFANELARFFSEAFGSEVRWNHQGSLQGHYV